MRVKNWSKNITQVYINIVCYISMIPMRPVSYTHLNTGRTPPMADNRKFYYLKLKENFFDSDSIVLLEDMKDGILYSNILLKL